MDNPRTPPASKDSKTVDPFGRMLPDDGSQGRFRDMVDVTVLEAAIGPTDDNRPDDVAKSEIMLDRIGLLDLRQTDGPTGLYGERLRQSIMALQRQSGLKETGRIVPNDPTHMALQRLADATRQKAEETSQPRPSAIEAPVNMP